MNMNRFIVRTTSFAALVVVGFIYKIDTAIAQQVVEKAQETVVVEMPVVRHKVVTSGTTAFKTEIIELKRRLSFADLELSNESDVTELEIRIETVAKDACRKLSDLLPLNASDRAEIRRCTIRAVDSAREQMQEAIEAAS